MDPDVHFSVAKASIEDVPEILELFRLDGQFVPNTARVLECWPDISGVPHVAKEDVSKEIVGFCCIVREQQFRGGVIFHAENVLVHPEFRGRGIGSLLLQEVVNQARSAHALRVALECQPSVIPFYSRLGFGLAGSQMTLPLISGD